ncbi:MAG TPA: Uma2 family endonuclease [Pyrinomonadaceae bacterium]|jgi:Uma2 family endonuclease
MSAVLKPKFDEEDFYPIREEGKPMAETDLHVTAILDLIQYLRFHFRDEPVVVLGDHTLYYERGNPKKFVAPDVFVVKGVEKELPRRVFKLWEEKPPSVVFEISSRSTWADDFYKKWKLYEQIGVLEYYIFDPEYDYLPEPIIAFKRKNGEFEKARVKKGRIFSEELGLEIVDTGKGLRLYEPKTKQFLSTYDEAQAEIARLRAELVSLKTK